MTLSIFNTKLISSVVAVAVAFSAAGCANKKKKSNVGEYAGIDGDYVTGTPLPDRQEGVNFMSNNVDKSQYPPIYFGYDSFTISPAETPKLEQVAANLRNSGANVIIAGFTDERGTEEYNRGLGERRALAVRQFLIEQGVPANNLQTVSFGEEMPADTGAGEGSWAKNRRAEFGVVK